MLLQHSMFTRFSRTRQQKNLPQKHLFSTPTNAIHKIVYIKTFKIAILNALI